ncbi:MAG: MOSC domain-containing protein [Acidobacteria bacterium]|nr:MAG: MOSC domain-containing protein [Acidobacteriota bacterium]
MTESVAGSIRSLWRYPVKSMLGEEIDRSAVTERGFVGDRAYALVDASDGKVASAKNPRKWPRMYECRAELDETPRRVRIRLPDGVVVAVDDPNAGAVLSRILGREVAIETAASAAPVLEELWLEGSPNGQDVTDERIALGSPAGSFFDYAVIHLVTTATLEHLSELYPQGRFDPRRFRPNALVSVVDGQAGFVENGWIGKTLALGDSVRLRVTDPCPRCVMTTLAQEELPADAGILRTAARHNPVVGGEGRGLDGAYPASVGVYASVVAGGTVRRGDTVRLIS